MTPTAPAAGIPDIPNIPGDHLGPVQAYRVFTIHKNQSYLSFVSRPRRNRRPAQQHERDEQIRQPGVNSGAYDIIAIISSGDKRYDSAENPASSRPSHQSSTAASPPPPETKKNGPYSPSCSTKTAASSKNSQRFPPLTHPRGGILYCSAVEAPNKGRASAIRRGCSGCNSHPTAHSIFPPPARATLGATPYRRPADINLSLKDMKRLPQIVANPEAIYKE